jgi:serine phosphatase RsbU (regulator of sigma subunit)/PAS domain-containing protein
VTLDPPGFVGATEALTALDNVGHFVGLLSPDGTLLEANAAALGAGGISRDDVVGRPFWEAHWWAHSAETQQQLREAIEAARRGAVVRYDVDVMAADEGRSLVTIDFRLTPVRGSDGAVRFLVPEGAPRTGRSTFDGGSHQSWAELVAELNAARAQNDALRMLASSLAASRTVEEVCAAIADALGPTVDAVFGNIAIVSQTGDSLQLFQPSDMDRDIVERWVSVPLDDTTPFGTAVLTGRAVHVADGAAIAEQFPIGADDARQIGLHSLAAHPVTVADGRVRAAIGLAWTVPTDALDQAVIEPVVALCGAALQRAWISDESSRLAALFDTLLQQAPVGFAFIDREFRYSHVNTRLAETNGIPLEDHLGRTVREIVPRLADQIIPVLQRVFDEGESLTGIEITGETPAQPEVTRIWEEGFYPVQVPGVGIIGAGVVIVEVTEQRRERAALREVAAHDREIARRLQAGLLPTSIPDVVGYEVCARYEAGTTGLRVGGDWYEVVEIRPGDVTIVVGDAVGHDLDAAITMSQIRNALTGLSHAHHDPATVVERLDEYAGHTPDAFASTLFYARLDPSTGELRYTLAGHHPPLLVHADGTHDWFDAEPGPPIGLTAPRSTATCHLDVGDTLVCYTDGLLEHHHEPIETGRRRLREMAVAGAGSTVQAMVADLIAHVPNQERPDDIVVLAVRRTR